jgi:hypothetical protein
VQESRAGVSTSGAARRRAADHRFGQSTGPAKEIMYAPVAARALRLNILKVAKVATICGVELFPAK